MVPGHPFNEMKPNSGRPARELDSFAQYNANNAKISEIASVNGATIGS
jgi:hypothetical protein